MVKGGRLYNQKGQSTNQRRSIMVQCNYFYINDSAKKVEQGHLLPALSMQRISDDNLLRHENSIRICSTMVNTGQLAITIINRAFIKHVINSTPLVHTEPRCLKSQGNYYPMIGFLRLRDWEMKSQRDGLINYTSCFNRLTASENKLFSLYYHFYICNYLFEFYCGY